MTPVSDWIVTYAVVLFATPLILVGLYLFIMVVGWPVYDLFVTAADRRRRRRYRSTQIRAQRQANAMRDAQRLSGRL